MRIAKPDRVRRETSFELAAPAQLVFPLFCPVREREWVPGWDPQVVYSQSGLVERDCVFVTIEGEAAGAPRALDAPAKKNVWIVTEHDTDLRRLTLVCVAGQRVVKRLDLAVSAVDERRSQVFVRYTLTALDADGQTELARLDAETFTRTMASWRAAIDALLREPPPAAPAPLSQTLPRLAGPAGPPVDGRSAPLACSVDRHASSNTMSEDHPHARETFTVYLSPDQLARLDRYACDFVGALLELSHRILSKDPAFPSLLALGLAPAHAAFLQRRVPARADELLLLGRLDVTTDGQDFASYELNGDQPGGLAMVAELWHGQELPPAGAPPSPEYRAYLDAALGFYRGSTGRSAPRGVLLLPNAYVQLAMEQRELAAYFGQPVHVAEDLGRCSFDGHELGYRDDAGRGHVIDLVFRSPRVNIYQLVAPEYAAVREAYLAAAVVLVNPPHSRVAGCKSLYGLLAEPRLQDAALLSDAQRDAIAALLPTTILIDDAVRARLRDQRHDWVLKAPLGGRGAQVWLGPEVGDEAWKQLLAEAGQGYVAQAFRPPFRLPIRVDREPATRPPVPNGIAVPIGIAPYVTGGTSPGVAGHLVRAVIPLTADDAELENVKLNLLGVNDYVDSDGQPRHRVVGLGRIDTGAVPPARS